MFFYVTLTLTAQMFIWLVYLVLFVQERLSMIGPEEFIQAFCKQRIEPDVSAVRLQSYYCHVGTSVGGAACV